MSFHDWVHSSALLFEGAGVAAMIGGVLVAVVRAGLRVRALDRSWYTEFRETLGRGILLGLEFLVAADIIRTVSSAPTLLGVTVLGLIVLIRTFLSFTLKVELEGRWPWQAKR